MAEKSAKLTAFRMLAIKNFTTIELKRKLKLRKFSDEAILEAISACERLGYLNDEEEEKRRVEKLKSRGYGPYIISAKLGKSVKIPIAEQKKSVVAFIQKKKGKTKQQILRALQRRGFDLEALLEVVEDIS